MGRLDAGAAILGCAFALASLALIWGARAAVGRPIYVSELGAVGMATREVFTWGLLSLVAAGVLIGWAGRHVRGDALRGWSPSVSLWLASALFLVASQVTCTYGCPAPVGAAFTWQDLGHTLAAVLAFCLACVAMLQLSRVRPHHSMTTLSAVGAWSVAGFAGVGGILGLLRDSVEVGAAFEFAAMTIAVCWVVAFGASLAAPLVLPARMSSKLIGTT